MSGELSVVVVIHDSAPELARLLGSLEAHLRPAPQLVVVDNASTDGGAALARERGAEVLALGENAGFGAAANQGVALARGDVVALLNPDVELLDGGLARLAELARGRDALFVPRLLNDDGTRQRSAHPLPGTFFALLPALVPTPLLPGRVRRRADPWRAASPGTVGWAIAACLAARTATLLRLGPFDQSLFLFYEDLDLCLRAAAAGVATELRPEIALRHSGGHATRRRYGGEPHLEMARRRREVVGRALGRRALLLDDAAQGLTFATRSLYRAALGRDSARERAQLRALLAARRH